MERVFPILHRAVREGLADDMASEQIDNRSSSVLCGYVAERVVQAVQRPRKPT